MKDESGREGSRSSFTLHPSSFVLLTMIIALVFAAIGVSSPLVTLYFETLGADYRHISFILASSAAVGLVSNYLWGRVSDRLGRRKPLIVAGLAGGALAYFLLSRVASPELAWVVRLWEALILAAYMTTSLAFMGDLLAPCSVGGLAPRSVRGLAQRDRPATQEVSAAGGRRGQRMGTYRGIGSLAFAVGAVIGGRIADQFSLRQAFMVCAGFYALAALIALALHEVRSDAEGGLKSLLQGKEIDPPREDVCRSADAGPLNSQRRDVAQPSLRTQGLPWLFLAGVALWSAAWYAQASLWPNYMAKLGYAKSTISSLWGLAALVEAPSMRWIGRFSDVAGRLPLLAASGLGAALVMAGYIFLVRWLAPLLCIQFVRGVTFADHTATAMTYATETGDARTRGHHSGLYNAATGGGQLLGLLMSGILAQAGGFELLFGVCAAVALLGGVCFWGLTRVRF